MTRREAVALVLVLALCVAAWYAMLVEVDL